jgi:hypothetical protein
MNRKQKLLLAFALPILVVGVQGAASPLNAQDFDLPEIGGLNSGIDLPANPLPGDALSADLPSIDSAQSSLRGEVIKAITAVNHHRNNSCDIRIVIATRSGGN